MIGIYKITSPTNKIYIGQSWTIEKREKAYGAKSCKKQPKLYFSINNMGGSLINLKQKFFFPIVSPNPASTSGNNI